MRSFARILPACTIAAIMGPSFQAGELPEPYDPDAQVQVLRQTLSTDPQRYSVRAVDLFEEPRPYRPRAASTMLSEARLIYKVPDLDAFESERGLVREFVGATATFEKSLMVHASFDIPGRQNLQLLAQRPVPIQGQLQRASIWVHSSNSAHRLELLFRSDRGRRVQANLGPLLFNGWRRLDVDLPPELYRESRQADRPYTHYFLGFAIYSSRRAEQRNFSLMMDNLLVLADTSMPGYPGIEFSDRWP